MRQSLRRWAALGLVFVTVGLSAAMVSPYLTLFLDDAVGADATQVAVLLVVAPLSSVVVSAIIGRISDRLPSRRGLLTGAALAGCASSALAAVVRDYWAFLIITITLTACAQAMLPQMFAYARESVTEPDRVAMTMSTLRTLFSLAWVAGPPLASVLLTTGGFTLTFTTSSLMYATAAAVAYLALRGRRAAVSDDGPTVDGHGADAPRRTIWSNLAVFVLTWAATNLAVQSLPLFTTRELGHGVGSAGLLLGLCAGLEIPIMIGLGVLSLRIPVGRLLIVGAGCGFAYMTLVCFATDLWQLAAGQVLNATAIAALSGLGITYMQDMMPRDRGRASTLYTNSIPIGGLLAGPVLGAAQQAGYRLPYAVAALCYVVALGLLVLARTGGSGGSGATIVVPMR
ncbi:MFS transporter [Solwaraspora sp. WMMB335]|uniref:MFS transporter n=1 Tax=Solwaraspora sp. WMMB335 TaxID=3404118 RepID=UPI003B953BC5